MKVRATLAGHPTFACVQLRHRPGRHPPFISRTKTEGEEVWSGLFLGAGTETDGRRRRLGKTRVAGAWIRRIKEMRGK